MELPPGHPAPRELVEREAQLIEEMRLAAADYIFASVYRGVGQQATQDSKTMNAKVAKHRELGAELRQVQDQIRTLALHQRHGA